MNNRLIIFLLIILSESLLLTFLRGKAGVYISPIVFFIVSVSTALFPLVFHKKNNTNWLNLKSNKLIVFGLNTSLWLWCTYLLIKIILKNPVDPALSDIIPTVDILSNRLISGEYPYKLITEYGYHISPTYLPLQWLPFVISALFEFDHRIIPFALFVLAVLLIQKKLVGKNRVFSETIFSTLLPPVLILLFLLKFPAMFATTIELLPASWYILFCLLLLTGNSFLQATGIILPLLSRYSLVLWLPLLVLFFLKKYSLKHNLKVFIFSILLIALIYVIPFVIPNPESVVEGFKYYSESALGEWQLKDFQQSGDKPVHLFRGIGFASFYYDFYPGNIEQKLHACKTHHLWLSALCCLILIIIWIKKKHWQSNYLFLFASLKIYLVFFYSFIQVPYIYLQLVPISISVILFYLWQNKPLKT